jgi:CheY-like chemotaxis protein
MSVRADAKLVLVVEDHADTRELVGLVLAHLGYRVAAAGTAAEARALMAAGAAADAVLADVGLPDADGCELMRELRAAYGVPGVALTGYARPEDLARCRAAGFAAVVVKPAMIADIERAMAAALATAAHGNACPAPGSLAGGPRGEPKPQATRGHREPGAVRVDGDRDALG